MGVHGWMRMILWLVDCMKYAISFLAVENIVFCRMTHLQLSLYKHLLCSRLFKSCLRSSSNLASSSGHQFPPHLVCIGALKKLCNTPSLIYAAAKHQETLRGVRQDDQQDEVPMDKVHVCLKLIMCDQCFLKKVVIDVLTVEILQKYM